MVLVVAARVADTPHGQFAESCDLDFLFKADGFNPNHQTRDDELR